MIILKCPSRRSVPAQAVPLDRRALPQRLPIPCSIGLAAAALAGAAFAQAPSVGVPQGPAPLVQQAPSLTSARVISVTSVAQPASAARLVCTEVAEVPAPTSGAGAVVGALAGAAIGSQIGGGSGNALATAAGVVGGALLGDKAEQGGRTQTVRQCVTHSGAGPGVAYQVLYEFAGQQYSTLLPYHPGATVQLQVSPVVSSPVASSPVVGAPGAPAASPPTPWDAQPAGAAPALQAPAVVTHSVVVSAPSYGFYGPYGYSAYSPYWGAPVVVGVGAVWGRPYRGWHGHHRRW